MYKLTIRFPVGGPIETRAEDIETANRWADAFAIAGATAVEIVEERRPVTVMFSPDEADAVASLLYTGVCSARGDGMSHEALMACGRARSALSAAGADCTRYVAEQHPTSGWLYLKPGAPR